MIRTRLAICLFALTAACGGDSATATQKGTAIYTRDANTCTGASLSFDYFLDGVQIGSSALAAGQSASFPAAAGTHVFSARVTNTTASFASINGTIASGGSFTYTMICR